MRNGVGYAFKVLNDILKMYRLLLLMWNVVFFSWCLRNIWRKLVG